MCVCVCVWVRHQLRVTVTGLLLQQQYYSIHISAWSSARTSITCTSCTITLHPSHTSPHTLCRIPCSTQPEKREFRNNRQAYHQLCFFQFVQNCHLNLNRSTPCTWIEECSLCHCSLRNSIILKYLMQNSSLICCLSFIVLTWTIYRFIITSLYTKTWR